MISSSLFPAVITSDVIFFIIIGALYEWSAYYPLSLFVGGGAMVLSGVSMIYPCIRPQIIRGISGTRKVHELDVEDEMENDDLIK